MITFILSFLVGSMLTRYLVNTSGVPIPVTFTDKPKRFNRVINRSGVFNSKKFNSYENLKKNIDASL